MDNEKTRMTPAQIVLVVCALVVIFAAILLLSFGLAGVFDAESAEILQPAFWSMLMVSNLLLACANWKRQKVISSVQIGVWSFFLGVFVSMLIITLTK